MQVLPDVLWSGTSMVNPSAMALTLSTQATPVLTAMTTAPGGIASLQDLLTNSVQTAMAPMYQLMRSLEGMLKSLQLTAQAARLSGASSSVAPTLTLMTDARLSVCA